MARQTWPWRAARKIRCGEGPCLRRPSKPEYWSRRVSRIDDTEATIADHWETGLSLTPDKRRRLLFATIASAATGGIIYVLVMHVALPSVRARLTPAYVEWLRDAFAAHPFIVLGVIVMFAAVLAAPVFGVFRWVYGPLTRR